VLHDGFVDEGAAPGASGVLLTLTTNLVLDATSATALVAGSVRSRTVVL
jgi:hypothetical protein